jgi:phosphoketolase
LHEGYQNLGVGQQRQRCGAGCFSGKRLRREALAAVATLRQSFPDLKIRFVDLKIRFVNVVDLCRLQPDTEHSPWLSHQDFDFLFAKYIGTSAE